MCTIKIYLQTLLLIQPKTGQHLQQQLTTFGNHLAQFWPTVGNIWHVKSCSEALRRRCGPVRGGRARAADLGPSSRCPAGCLLAHTARGIPLLQQHQWQMLLPAANACRMCQNLARSFSVVSKPNFASTYPFGNYTIEDGLWAGIKKLPLKDPLVIGLAVGEIYRALHSALVMPFAELLR